MLRKPAKFGETGIPFASKATAPSPIRNPSPPSVEALPPNEIVISLAPLLIAFKAAMPNPIEEAPNGSNRFSSVIPQILAISMKALSPSCEMA